MVAPTTKGDAGHRGRVMRAALSLSGIHAGVSRAR